MTHKKPKRGPLCRVCHEPLAERSYRTVNVVALTHAVHESKQPCVKSRRYVPFPGIRVHDGCERRYLGTPRLFVSIPYAAADLVDVFGRAKVPSPNTHPTLLPSHAPSTRYGEIGTP